MNVKDIAMAIIVPKLLSLKFECVTQVMADPESAGSAELLHFTKTET